MIDAHKAKVKKNYTGPGYIFVDELEHAKLSLNFIASEYGIDYDDAKKICITNKGFTREGYGNYGYWIFSNEDDATSALTILKLMR